LGDLERDEAQLVATACSSPPEGRARRTLELVGRQPRVARSIELFVNPKLLPELL